MAQLDRCTSDYPKISVPVTLVYGDEDWSRPPERDAYSNAIPGTRASTLEATGHFSCLEKPREIAELIMTAA